MKTRHKVIILLLALLVVSGGFIAYRYSQDTQPTPTPSQTAEQQPAKTSGSSSETPSSYSVLVYFSKHPESDDDPSKVFAVKRAAPDLAVGTFAITELLKGPTATERTKGYFTTVSVRNAESTCNEADFKLTIKDRVATLSFCRPFDHRGVVADGQADSSIKATLGQFDTVDKVIILNRDNHCEFDLSGLDICLQ